MLDFEGRVIIVTGAARGMGTAHARALVERGACVVVNDLGGSLDGSGFDKRHAEAVAQQIRDLGGRAIASTETVATSAGENAIVAQAIAEFGQLDGVLHNAGISTLIPLAKITARQSAPLNDASHLNAWLGRFAIPAGSGVLRPHGGRQFVR